MPLIQKTSYLSPLQKHNKIEVDDLFKWLTGNGQEKWWLVQVAGNSRSAAISFLLTGILPGEASVPAPKHAAVQNYSHRPSSESTWLLLEQTYKTCYGSLQDSQAADKRLSLIVKHCQGVHSVYYSQKERNEEKPISVCFSPGAYSSETVT